MQSSHPKPAKTHDPPKPHTTVNGNAATQMRDHRSIPTSAHHHGGRPRCDPRAPRLCSETVESDRISTAGGLEAGGKKKALPQLDYYYLQFLCAAELLIGPTTLTWRAQDHGRRPCGRPRSWQRPRSPRTSNCRHNGLQTPPDRNCLRYLWAGLVDCTSNVMQFVTTGTLPMQPPLPSWNRAIVCCFWSFFQRVVSSSV